MYADQTVGDFLDAVASDAPAPGGGAVAAVTAGLAAGLVAMTARFTAGAEATAVRADELRAAVLPLADADAAAFTAVLAAYRQPKDDPEARRAAIRSALRLAAEVPLEVVGIAAAVASAGADLVATGNPNLRGDATTAVLLAEAAAGSAATLVRLNLDGGAPDDDLTARLTNGLVTVAAAVARSGVRAALAGSAP